MNWLTNRLSEPSSYAGLALFTSAVSNIAAGSFDPISILMGLGGIVSFILPEATPVLNAVGSIAAQAIATANAASTTANTALASVEPSK